MTVNLEWSDFWLNSFAGMDSPSKTEFLRNVDIVRLVQTVTDEVQIEVLEHAPVELINYLREHLRPKAIQKLLPKQYVEPKTQPLRKLPDKVYMDLIKRIQR